MPSSPSELRQSALFAAIDDKTLGRIANQMKERRFAGGATVVAEGEHGAGFFVILEGDANVSVGGEHRITLGPGDHFGEVALLDEEGSRSATITAATDMRCYGLTPWEFRPFVEEHPKVAWALLQALARRLRSS